MPLQDANLMPPFGRFGLSESLMRAIQDPTTENCGYFHFTGSYSETIRVRPGDRNPDSPWWKPRRLGVEIVFFAVGWSAIVVGLLIAGVVAGVRGQ